MPHLYLIPSSLGHNNLSMTLPPGVAEIINSLDEFIVENIKSAAGFLKNAGYKRPLQQVTFSVLNVNSKDREIGHYLDTCVRGGDVGLISEAGCPCVGDPGAKIVTIAHEKGVKVVPLTGPCSFVLALMASGLNGQRFTFHGYLPIDKDEKRKALRFLEESATEGVTQIFMETPYRNSQMLQDILATCKPDVLLCVAVDLTLPTEQIVTKRVGEWRNVKMDLNKRPAVFLLGK